MTASLTWGELNQILNPYSWLAAFKLKTFDQIARAPPLWYITQAKASPWPC